MQSINLPGVLAAALVGAVAGFFVGQSMVPESEPEIQVVTEYVSEESGEKVVPETLLPIPRDLLLNPVFYEWTAHVDGVVVAKTSDSLTLEQSGQRFTIDIADTTRFLDQRGVGSSGGGASISFSDVPLRASIRGSVFVFDQRDALAGSKVTVATVLMLY